MKTLLINLCLVCSLILLVFSYKAKPIISATDYWVNPVTGSNANDGSYNRPLKTIKGALDKLLQNSGGTIYLMEGFYHQSIYIEQGGTLNNPLRIIGSRNAIVCGEDRDESIDEYKGKRIISLAGSSSSYVELYGFTVDGLCNRSDSNLRNYYDKLIYINGETPNNGPQGIKIIDLAIRNAGAECVRFRFNTHSSEFAYNQVANCGQYYFSPQSTSNSKNGEGLYIGTAPSQSNNIPDTSNSNYVHHNDFDTQGNECVDVKEGAANNLVEYNNCTGQKDVESGGLDSRGNNNTFRFNYVYRNLGAGVRLGGSGEYGENNIVIYNYLEENYEGINIVGSKKQTAMCGNIRIGGRDTNDGLAACPSTYPTPISYYGSAGGGSPRPTPVILQPSMSTKTPSPTQTSTPILTPSPTQVLIQTSTPTLTPSPTQVLIQTSTPTPSIDPALNTNIFLPSIFKQK